MKNSSNTSKVKKRILFLKITNAKNKKVNLLLEKIPNFLFLELVREVPGMPKPSHYHLPEQVPTSQPMNAMNSAVYGRRQDRRIVSRLNTSISRYLFFNQVACVRLPNFSSIIGILCVLGTLFSSFQFCLIVFHYSPDLFSLSLSIYLLDIIIGAVV